MSPLLDNTSKIPDKNVKFVREGKVVAYGENKNEDHLSLADKYNLGEFILERGRYFGKAWVDGSGYIRSEEGSIILSGESTNCMPRKHVKESREEDAEVVGRITGKEVRY